MGKIYLRVTKDEYELPTAVALSAAEMARITGRNHESIASQCSRRKLHGAKTEFVSVEVEEDEEE